MVRSETFLRGWRKGIEWVCNILMKHNITPEELSYLQPNYYKYWKKWKEKE